MLKKVRTKKHQIMKTTLFILALTVSVSTATSCKTKKEATASTTATSSSTATPGVSGTIAITSTETNTTASSSQGVHAGKVSHKYRAGGCETVIIINAHDDVVEITLIPKDKLNKDIDVDGQNITFDYHPLKCLSLQVVLLGFLLRSAILLN